MGTIFAVEGPSGAGKDHFISHYPDPGIFKIPRPIYPRLLSPKLGVYSSSIADYQAIAYAMIMDQDCMVNRFLLSRYVYMAFEKGMLPGSISYDWFKFNAAADLWKSFLGHMNHVKEEYYLRDWNQLRVTVPTIIMTVILPNMEILRARRANTGKEYPFDPVIESTLYWDLVQALRPYTHLQIILKEN